MTDLTELPIVSVDDHILEGPAIWADRLPARYQQAGPRLVRERIGDNRWGCTWQDVWHIEDVRVPLTRIDAPAGHPPEDTDDRPAIIDDFRSGCTNPEGRLEDMTADGVLASLLFPNLFVRFCGQRFLEAKDKELGRLCVAAYNDYVMDVWAATAPDRLVPAAIVPMWDAELAAAEVRRNAARGCSQVCFSEIPPWLGLPSLYSGYWDPFIAACEETNTVINMHIGSSSSMAKTSDDAGHTVRVANHYVNSSLALSDWLMSGLFEKFRTVRVAFSEGQAGWIPYIVRRLDGMWKVDNAVLEIQLPDPPSTYLRDHVYSCVFEDQTAMEHIDFLGEDNLCFETDYPHADGSFPHSVDRALEVTEILPARQREKVLRGNGARLLGIPVPGR
jgi:predicted TIM-barrel fold metal-dependent hydrolase